MAVIGLFGMIFAWTKIAASRATKTPLNNDPNSAPSDTSTNAVPITSTPSSDDSTPDWLKNTESPFGSEDVLSKEVSESKTEAHTPDWMNDHTEHVEKEVKSAPTITAPEPVQSAT